MWFRNDLIVEKLLNRSFQPPFKMELLEIRKVLFGIVGLGSTEKRVACCIKVCTCPLPCCRTLQW